MHNGEGKKCIKNKYMLAGLRRHLLGQKKKINNWQKVIYIEIGHFFFPNFISLPSMNATVTRGIGPQNQ